MRVFFDTNVLVYADDADAADKRDVARRTIEGALRDGTGVLSPQVLGEYFVVATRKLGLPADYAQRNVSLYSRFEVSALTANDVVEAIKLHRLHGLSYWDALIVQAAKAAGCTVVLSEDMRTRASIDGVTITNPFA
jgi:predicted nucleic acid-binding protein